VVPPIEAKKSAYIDLLMKLVETAAGSNGQGEVQKDLLDRLERALGYDDVPQPVRDDR